MLRSLGRIFEVDLRSLALFRVALGGVFVWDVIGRACDLRAHYSEQGVLPVALAVQLQNAAVRASPFAWLSDHPVALGLLFALMVVAGVMLALGYRTRTATALCWLLIVLLQLRNGMVYFGGDALLRVLLFWSLFVPLGARWSLDARFSGSEPPANRFRSLGSAALLLQIATVYWVTGLSKNDPAWSDGTAVWYALNLDLYVTRFGIWLRQWTWLIPILTHGSRGLELIGPCLALSPIWNGPLRTAAVVSFAGFHSGLWLCLDIGFFQALSIAAWLAFLPAWFWDSLVPRMRSSIGADRPGARSLTAPRWLEAAAVVPLAYLVLFAAFSGGGLLVRGRSFDLPGPVAIVGRALRLNQSWSMFMGFGDRSDNWLVVDATLSDGRHVDPYRRAPLSWDKAEPLAEQLGTLRWRQVVRSVLVMQPSDPAAGPVRAAFSEYLCRDWNGSHGDGERVEKLDLVAIEESTRLYSVAPRGRLLLFQHRCARPGQRSAPPGG